MRTLKKTLCLVLCLAMMVGLCAVGASAKEFTDADEIKYKEAVDLLTGIGVIDGMGDGTFNPAGTLTRAQACKILTYILGYEDISATSTFTDTKGHWAEGPIALCAGEGIVNGMGDGTFNPDGTLTGSAWGKMLLGALGYNAEFEGMTGESWEVGVAKTLKKTGLLAGLTGLDLAKQITRETACQMAYNALGEPTKDFNPGMQINTGDVSITGVGGYAADKAPLGDSVFGMAHTAGDKPAAVTGIVVSTPETDSTKAYTVVNVTNASTTGIALGNKNFSLKLGADMVGRQIKIYPTTFATKGVYTAYSYVDQTKEVVITAAMSAAQVQAAFKAAGITANIAAGYDQIRNGAVVAPGGTGAGVNMGATAGAGIAGTFFLAGSPAAVIGEKIADVTTVDTVTDIKTTAGKETITFSALGEKQNNAESDVVKEYDGIAKGDLVVSKLCGDVYVLSKVTTIEGKITKKSTTPANNITVDGKTYYAYGGAVTAPALAGTDVGFVGTGFNATYTIYLADGACFAYVVKVAAKDTTLVYAQYKYTKNVAISGSEYAGDAQPTLYFVQCVDTKGDVVNYQVKQAEYATINQGTFNKIYVENGKDSAYADADPAKQAAARGKAFDYADFTEVAAAGAATDTVSSSLYNGAAAIAKATTKSVTVGGNNYYLDDNMTVLYVNGTGTALRKAVVTGKVDVAAGVNTVFYGTKNDTTSRNYTVKFAVVQQAPAGTATGTGIIFANETAASAVKVPYTQADGSNGEAFQHVVYIDGVKKEIPHIAATAIAGVKTYEIDKTTGLYTNLADYTYTKAGAVVNNYNGTVSFADNNAANHTKDIDLTGATLVNVVASTDANYSKIATTVTALTTHETITVVYDSKWVPTFVYITAYT